MVAAVPAAAEETGPAFDLRQQSDRSGERGSDGTGQDVTIPHMPQLVSEHSFELFVVEKIENALGYCNGGVFWVSPGSKSCLLYTSTQVAICGRDIPFPIDLIFYKQLTMSGSICYTTRTWERMMKIYGEGRVRLDDLVSTTLPISEWRTAFALCEDKKAIKVLMYPEI